MYYMAWSIYARNYVVDDIDASKITHINYAFANVVNGQCVLGDEWADIGKPFDDDTWDTPIKGNFGRLMALKKKNPHLKTLLSVGGWTWSTQFSQTAMTASSRKLFAESCVNMATKYGFGAFFCIWF